MNVRTNHDINIYDFHTFVLELATRTFFLAVFTFFEAARSFLSSPSRKADNRCSFHAETSEQQFTLDRLFRASLLI